MTIEARIALENNVTLDTIASPTIDIRGLPKRVYTRLNEISEEYQRDYKSSEDSTEDSTELETFSPQKKILLYKSYIIDTLVRQGTISYEEMRAKSYEEMRAKMKEKYDEQFDQKIVLQAFEEVWIDVLKTPDTKEDINTAVVNYNLRDLQDRLAYLEEKLDAKSAQTMNTPELQDELTRNYLYLLYLEYLAKILEYFSSPQAQEKTVIEAIGTDTDANLTYNELFRQAYLNAFRIGAQPLSRIMEERAKTNTHTTLPVSGLIRERIAEMVSTMESNTNASGIGQDQEIKADQILDLLEEDENASEEDHAVDPDNFAVKISNAKEVREYAKEVREYAKEVREYAKEILNAYLYEVDYPPNFPNSVSREIVQTAVKNILFTDFDIEIFNQAWNIVFQLFLEIAEELESQEEPTPIPLT